MWFKNATFIWWSLALLFIVLNVARAADSRERKTGDVSNLGAQTQVAYDVTSRTIDDVPEPGTNEEETRPNKGRFARQAESADLSSEPAYLVDCKGFKLTKQQFNELDVNLQQALRDDGCLDPPKSGVSSRSVTVNEPKAVYSYDEDSGTQPIILTPIEIDGTSQIDDVTIEIINVLDSGNEVLSVANFTLTRTVDIGGRNVTFDYDVIPVTSYDGRMLTISGLINHEEYEMAINSLMYINSAENPSDTLRGLTISINYASTDETNVNIYFFVFRRNDSPYFGSQPPQITIQEDSAVFEGLTSTNIPFLGNTVVDNDPGALLGIAVLGADNRHGIWRYETSPGVYADIASGVRDSDHNILRTTSLTQTSLIISENHLIFFPDANFHGESSITFVAYDKTGTSQSLSHGDFANVTWTQNGAFGPDMGTVQVVIQPINDAPQATTSTVQLGTFSEDSTPPTGVPLSTFLQACDDVDFPYDVTLLNLGVAVTSVDATNGVWQFTVDGGANWQVLGVQGVLLGANGDVASYAVRFVPASNFYAAVDIKYKCWDFTSGSVGQTGVDTSYLSDGAFSQSEVTGTVTIENVNDQPTLTLPSADVTFPFYENAEQQNLDGTLIGELMAAYFNDDDPTDLPGLAVIEAESSTIGEFEYKCESVSSSWYAFVFAGGAGYSEYVRPTSTRATLLDSTCRLRFVQLLPLTGAVAPHIKVKAWDGSGGFTSGSYDVNIASSTSISVQQTSIVVSVTKAANQPEISGSQGDLTFTEGGSELGIFPDVTVTSSHTVSFDLIQISVSNALDESYEMLRIGSADGYATEADIISQTGATVTWNTHQTSVNFSGTFNAFQSQSIARSVTYVHTSANPTATSSGGARVLSLTARGTDGIASDAFLRNLEVVAVNSAPNIALNDSSTASTITMVPDATSIAIYPSTLYVVTSDPDDAAPSTVHITIDSSADATESLSVPDVVEKVLVHTDSLISTKLLRTNSNYNVATRTLTFSVTNSDVTASDYDDVISRVTYNNPAFRTSSVQRQISLHVVDLGGAVSNTVITSVDLVGNNTYVSSTSAPTTSAPPIAPSVTRILASPYCRPDNDLPTDAKISSGDEIRVTFSDDTNMPPFGHYDVTDPVVSAGKLLTRDEVDELFAFELAPTRELLGYSGRWESAREFVVTILNEGYPQQRVEVGSWFLVPRARAACSAAPNPLDAAQRYCIRDSIGLSGASSGNSPPLEGNWGLNVPTVSSVVVENSDVTDGVSYVSNVTSTVISLRPALSQTQINSLCDKPLNQLFGPSLLSAFPQLETSLAKCENQVVSEWDLSLTSGSDVPTVTKLFLDTSSQFSGTYRSLDVAAGISGAFDLEEVIDVVSHDTGVESRLYSDYAASNLANESLLLVAKDNSITPAVVNVTIESSNSSIDVITTGDVIVIVFDRDTDQPPVGDKEQLNRVLTLGSTSATNYSATWRDNRTLAMTLLDLERELDELSVAFRANVLSDESAVPSGFSSDPSCVGVAVCGEHPNSRGICDSSATSCRASGTFSARKSLQVAGESPDSVGWWWILVLGIALLGCLLVVAFLGRRVYMRRNKGEEGYADEYEKQDSSTFPRRCWEKVNCFSFLQPKRTSLGHSLPSSSQLPPERRRGSPSSRGSRRVGASDDSSVFSVTQQRAGDCYEKAADGLFYDDTIESDLEREIPSDVSNIRENDVTIGFSPFSLKSVSGFLPQTPKSSRMGGNFTPKPQLEVVDPLAPSNALLKWRKAVSAIRLQQKQPTDANSDVTVASMTSLRSPRFAVTSEYVPSFSRAGDVSATGISPVGPRSPARGSISGLPMTWYVREGSAHAHQVHFD